MSYNKSHVIMIKCKWDTLNSDAAMRSKYFGGREPTKRTASVLFVRRQAAGRPHQGPAHASSCRISAAEGKVAAGGSRFSLRPTCKNKDKENKTSSASTSSLARVKTVKKKHRKHTQGCLQFLGSTLMFITSGVHTRLIRE